MTLSKLFCILVLAASFAACSRSSDEEQIRALIEAAEVAVEARDTSDVMEHIADDYRDDMGNDKDQLQTFLRGYLLMHPKIELIISIKEVKLETDNRAYADITVAMLGTKGLDNQSSLTADSQSLRVNLKRVDSKWRVSYVDRTNH
jgi:ketosteroid isomerase-like protein